MERPWVYLDTSAYLKLFIRESGSTKARKIVRQSRVLSSAVLAIESYSALSRRRHSGEIGGKEFETLVSRIKESILSIETVRVTDEILQRAEQVTLRSNARALDAIHISSALLFQEAVAISLPFITSDKKQCDAAGRQGLETLLIE